MGEDASAAGWYPERAAAWYPDPAGSGQQRYFDGQQWTQNFAPMSPAPYYQPVTVVEGPNHVLHAVLTLLTFWACGGWAWVWLIVALSNKKTVRRL